MIISNRSALLFVLYLLGIIHWLVFTRYGAPSLSMFDWPQAHQWFDIYRLAFDEFRIPFHGSYFATEGEDSFYIWGKRVFAVPHLTFSPDMLTLSFLTSAQFLKWRILFVYSIAFWGCVKWIKKFDLSPIPSAFLIIACLFNGAMMSRIGAGHVTLATYFLIPLFLFYFYELITVDFTKSQMWRQVLKISFLLAFILSLGGAHNIYQMGVITALSLFVLPRRFYLRIAYLALSALFVVHYIVPVAKFGMYMDSNRQVFTGFGARAEFGAHIGTNFQYYESVNAIYNMIVAMINGRGIDVDLFWEYSLFISVFGFALLVFGTFYNLRQISRGNYKIDRWSMLGLFFLFFAVVAWSSDTVARDFFRWYREFIPIPAIDVLPSRLMTYGLVAMIIFSSVGLDLFLRNKEWFRKVTVGIFVFISGVMIFMNSWNWSVHNTEKNMVMPPEYSYANPKTQILSFEDSAYKWTVVVCFLLSFLFLAIGIKAYRYLGEKERTV